MLSKEEKERLIIRLLKKNKTYRKIAHLTNANPPQIFSIKKKLEGEEHQPNMNIRAFELFEQQNQPVDVTTALRIGAEETLKYYGEYLKLKGETKLLIIRNELKDDFEPFFDLYSKMKSNGYTLEELEESLTIIRQTNDAHN